MTTDDPAAILRQLDTLDRHVAALRAEIEARLEAAAADATLAARAARLRAAVVDLAATVAVRVAVMGPAHVVSAAAFWLDWWRGRAGAGPYRRDALAWWLRGGPLRDRPAAR